MAFINFAAQEVRCKIVYYGPARCGKTTNLKYVHSRIKGNVVGEMTSIDSRGDTTIFFDFLPLKLGKIGGLNIRIQLYTVPGQVHHNATRRLVLEGVDGVVFVADSLEVRRESNIESVQNLIENLKEQGIHLQDIPLVFQYNKRDLHGGAAPILPLNLMDRDLNLMLRVPAFAASALEGYGVFETLRAISKMTAKDVYKKMASYHLAVLHENTNRKSDTHMESVH